MGRNGDYPVRTCRSMHHCWRCEEAISYGQRYRDGGYTRRCHKDVEDCKALVRVAGSKERNDGS